MNETTKIVRVGDLIRISVALIRHMNEEDDGLSIAAELTEVQLEEDGTKVLMLTRRIDPEAR